MPTAQSTSLRNVHSALTPSYFEQVRAAAASDWEHWEATPRHAAPVRHLFSQIRSPQHVLSELLQNADDAGASWARARIEDDAFVFEHDGEDFAEEHFASLCRFGSSNKRHLHTIGFRGLGFKSVFSYGPQVHLVTPTLRVSFDERRFTEPVWREDMDFAPHVRIVVPFSDGRLAKRAAEDIQRWSASPVPLLFFQHVRRLELGERTVSIETLEPGPVPRSTWMRLKGTAERRVLVVRSLPLSMPAEALEELRNERSDLSFEAGEMELQLVYGLSGEERAYVVLPTNVAWQLPFSANAPFVQDPARLGIKDPDTSPLNRWLLHALGELAGRTMLGWLRRVDLSAAERADSYGLLPPADIKGGDLPTLAARTVLDGMRTTLEGVAPVLTHSGRLVAPGEAMDLPPELVGIWSDAEAARLFSDHEDLDDEEDGAAAPSEVLAPEISGARRGLLAAWDWIDRLEKSDARERFSDSQRPVPRPDDDGLERLWEFFKSETWRLQYGGSSPAIVPVTGDMLLRRASEVVVVGNLQERLGAEDWAFASRHVAMLDPAWSRMLQVPTARGREAADGRDQANEEAAARLLAPSARRAAVLEVARALRLMETTTLARMVERLAAALRAADALKTEGVHLAHLAARLNVEVGSAFPYQTRDGRWRSAADGLLAPSSEHTHLLPDAWSAPRVLHQSYERDLPPVELERWRGWVASGRSGLHRFAVPTTAAPWSTVWQARQLAQSRGADADFDLPYRRGDILVHDPDFAPELWTHWRALAASDPGVWTDVLCGCANAWRAVRPTRTGDVQMRARTNSQTLAEFPSAWVVAFRGLACVRDATGEMRLPATLYRNTPETRDLASVEPFVDPVLDRSELHELLDELGVRSSPTSVTALVERLRALRAASTPLEKPIAELYRVLDRTMPRLPAEAASELAASFAEEPLVLGDDLQWHTKEAVFLDNPERLPGAVVVWPRVRSLDLWRLLGVAPQPTLQLLLDWLEVLPSGEQLNDAARARVRRILQAMPEMAVSRLGAWLDVTGCWRTLDELTYYTRTPDVTDRLYTHERAAIADASMLGEGSDPATLLASLYDLAEWLEHRTHVEACVPVTRPSWVEALATGFLRVPERLLAATGADMASDEAHPDHVAADELRRAAWNQGFYLSVTPVAEGKPVGPSQQVSAHWDAERQTVFVVGDSAEHYDALVAIVTRRLLTSRLREAVARCVDRDPAWIARYLANAFPLEAEPMEIEHIDDGAEDAGDVDEAADQVPDDAHDDAEDDLPSDEDLTATSAWADEEPEDEEDEVGTEGEMVIPRQPREVLSAGPGGPVEWARPAAAHAGAEASSSARGTPPDGRPIHVREHWRSEPGRRELVVTALAAHGYVASSDGVFRHPDGGRATLTSGEAVHARAYEADGSPRAVYWTGDADLGEGVEIAHESWRALERFEDRGWLVLPSAAGIRLLNFSRMRELATVHPASYRLVSATDG